MLRLRKGSLHTCYRRISRIFQRISCTGVSTTKRRCIYLKISIAQKRLRQIQVQEICRLCTQAWSQTHIRTQAASSVRSIHRTAALQLSILRLRLLLLHEVRVLATLVHLLLLVRRIHRVTHISPWLLHLLLLAHVVLTLHCLVLLELLLLLLLLLHRRLTLQLGLLLSLLHLELPPLELSSLELLHLLRSKLLHLLRRKLLPHLRILHLHLKMLLLQKLLLSHTSTNIGVLHVPNDMALRSHSSSHGSRVHSHTSRHSSTAYHSSTIRHHPSRSGIASLVLSTSSHRHGQMLQTGLQR